MSNPEDTTAHPNPDMIVAQERRAQTPAHRADQFNGPCMRIADVPGRRQSGTWQTFDFAESLRRINEISYGTSQRGATTAHSTAKAPRRDQSLYAAAGDAPIVDTTVAPRSVLSKQPDEGTEADA